ncbi:MAG TPA: hypothetical protein VHT91_33175 [Kofleriaceae bacterium]|nr:hypothetical protein [Kofleriaceae bacterium]
MDVSPAVAALGAAGMWLTISLAAPAAQAQPEASPDDIITRPLVLEPGAIDARLTLAINIQQRLISQPTALSPDAWWGVLPRLTVGLIHSDASLDQIATSGSFCIKPSSSTCARLYQGSGIDVRYSALEGQFALAPRLRAVIRDTDPFKPAVTLGALLRWAHGRFAITGDPYLRVPLANAPLGNRFAINLPVWFAVQPATGWMIAVRGGFESDLVVLRDGGHLPFALDVAARATDQIDVGLEAGWAGLVGPQHDARHATIMLAAGWRGVP